MMSPSKTEIKTFVRMKLANDPRWATQALVRIYERQTRSEQQSGHTIDRNYKGFSGKDAELLTSFAKQYLAKGFLTINQMPWLHRKIKHYSRQVIECSNQAKLLESFQNYINTLAKEE